MKNKMNSIIFFAVLLLILTLSGREKLSLFLYDDKIFLLDGFEKKLSVYTGEIEFIKGINLRNISSTGFFDFFAVFDPYRSYLNDAVAGIIRQLDENYSVKKLLDVGKTHNVFLSDRIFPVAYNSLIAASYKKDSVYLLRNNILSKIIEFGDIFYDFYVFEDEIFVLFSDRIMIYTAEGVFKSLVQLANEFTKIRPHKDLILLYNNGVITSLDRITKNTQEYQTGILEDFCFTGKYLIIIPEGRTEPIKVEI